MSNNVALASVKPIEFGTLDTSRSAFIERARDMVPHLLDQQAEVEKRTFYSEETHAMFRDAGFYRMLVPEQFGGYGLDAEVFFRVAVIIASGCPSTAWQYCFGHSHAVAAGSLFSQEVQAELFRDVDFICAGTIKPQGTVQRQADGSWILNGTFNYCSGIPHSTHFISHAFVVDESGNTLGKGTFVAPHSAWKRLDDWGGSLGLKGSGSHSIVFENAVLPAAFVLPGVDFVDHAPREDSPYVLHHGRPMSFLYLEPASIMLGAVKGALAEYEALLRTKTTMLPPIVPRTEDVDYRRYFGDAIGKIAFAEAALFDACRQWIEAAGEQQAGTSEFTVALDLTIRLICLEVMNTCWHVMESVILFSAGSSAAFDGQRIQRFFRDMAMCRAHALQSWVDPMRRDLADEVIKSFE